MTGLVLAILAVGASSILLGIGMFIKSAYDELGPRNGR